MWPLALGAADRLPGRPARLSWLPHFRLQVDRIASRSVGSDRRLPFTRANAGPEPSVDARGLAVVICIWSGSACEFPAAPSGSAWPHAAAAARRRRCHHCHRRCRRSCPPCSLCSPLHPQLPCLRTRSTWLIRGRRTAAHPACCRSSASRSTPPAASPLSQSNPCWSASAPQWWAARTGWGAGLEVALPRGKQEESPACWWADGCHARRWHCALCAELSKTCAPTPAGFWLRILHALSRTPGTRAELSGAWRGASAWLLLRQPPGCRSNAWAGHAVLPSLKPGSTRAARFSRYWSQ